MIEDQPAGTVTLVLPTSAFGTVGDGWVFTVALTGQNGFSPDNARGFTQPAGHYMFGVCPVGDTAAICSANPSTMPEAIDTITPDRRQPGDRAGPDARAGRALRGGSDESVSSSAAASVGRSGNVRTRGGRTFPANSNG